MINGWWKIAWLAVLAAVQGVAATTVEEGRAVHLSVTVDGTPPFTYEWRKDGVALLETARLSGVGSSRLTLASATLADGGAYSVVVRNAAGSTTGGPVALVVATQTASLAAEGRSITLGGSTAAAQPSWQRSDDGGLTWSSLTEGGRYVGASTGTLTISGLTSGDTGVVFRLVDGTGGKSTPVFATRLRVETASLPFPVGVAVLASGEIAVADAALDQVLWVGRDSGLKALAGASGNVGSEDGTGLQARFNDPAGLAVDSAGRLVLADRGNALVRRVETSGRVSRLAGDPARRGAVDGSAAAATFSAPAAVAMTSAGDVVVVDAMTHTVRRVKANGEVLTVAGRDGEAGDADGVGGAARFHQPSGVAVDRDGRIYVADTANHTLRRIDPDGRVTTLAGLTGVSGARDGTGADAWFDHPAGLAISSSGDLWVADSGSSTIRKVSREGRVTTVAGLPGVTGHKDGRGLDAWFNQPRALAVATDGSVIVADTGNASLRRLASDGAVTTLSLSAGDTVPSIPPPAPAPAPSPAPASPAGGSTGGGSGGGSPGSALPVALLGLGLAAVVVRLFFRVQGGCVRAGR